MSNKEYTKPCVLLVEGQDEVKFFTVFSEHIGKKGVFDIIDMNGKDHFVHVLKVCLQRPKAHTITAYVIVMDADNSHQSKFRSICDVLARHGNGLPIPERVGVYAYDESQSKKVGIYIMPGDSRDGMLEDLFLETVSDSPIMPCLDEYFSCLKGVLPQKPENVPAESGKHFPKNASKTRALGFLAASYESVNTVGLAAQKKYWNFDHPTLTELRSFLGELEDNAAHSQALQTIQIVLLARLTTSPLGAPQNIRQAFHHLMLNHMGIAAAG